MAFSPFFERRLLARLDPRGFAARNSVGGRSESALALPALRARPTPGALTLLRAFYAVPREMQLGGRRSQLRVRTPRETVRIFGSSLPRRVSLPAAFADTFGQTLWSHINPPPVDGTPSAASGPVR